APDRRRGRVRGRDRLRGASRAPRRARRIRQRPADAPAGVVPGRRDPRGGRRRGRARGDRSGRAPDRRADGGAGRAGVRVAAPEDAVSEPNRLEARGLVAGYGGAPVLRGLDAAIPAGAIAAVLGENGSGKSTLLKVFARVVAIGGGGVLLDGEPLDALPRRRT